MSNETPKKTNAFIRVYNIINTANSIGNRNNNDKHCANIWAKVFKIETDKTQDVSGYYKEITSKLMQLDDDICEALELTESESSQIPPQKLKRHLISIRNGISPLLLDKTWNSVSQHHFKPENISVIDVAGYMFPDHQCLPEKEELNEFHNQLKELRDMVEKSNSLPQEVKDLIQKKLLAISHAIEGISLFGLKGLQEHTNELLGMCLTNEQVGTSIQNEKKQPIKNKLFKLVGSATALLNKGTKTGKSIEYTANLSEKLENIF